MMTAFEVIAGIRAKAVLHEVKHRTSQKSAGTEMQIISK